MWPFKRKESNEEKAARLIKEFPFLARQEVSTAPDGRLRFIDPRTGCSIDIGYM